MSVAESPQTEAGGAQLSSGTRAPAAPAVCELPAAPALFSTPPAPLAPALAPQSTNGGSTLRALDAPAVLDAPAALDASRALDASAPPDEPPEPNEPCSCLPESRVLETSGARAASTPPEGAIADPSAQLKMDIGIASANGSPATR